MSHETEHSWFLERIADAIERRLSDEEQNRFDAHANACESCAAEFRAVQQLEKDMSTLFTSIRPDALFESRMANRFRMNMTTRWIHPIVRKCAIAAAAAMVFGGAGYFANQEFERGTMPLWGGNSLSSDVQSSSQLRQMGQAGLAHQNDNKGQWNENGRLYGYRFAPASGSLSGANSYTEAKRGEVGFTVGHVDFVNGSTMLSREVSRSDSDADGAEKAGESRFAKEVKGTSTFDVSGRDVPRQREIVTNGAVMNGGTAGGGIAVADSDAQQPVTTWGYFGVTDFEGTTTGRGVEILRDNEGEHLGVRVKEGAVRAGDLAMVVNGEPAAANQPQVEQQPQPPAQVEVAQRKIIRNGEVQFEVDSFDTAAGTVAKIVSEETGYIATTNSEKLPNGKVQGSIIVRVPPEHLDTLVMKLRALGDLKRQNLTASDVTKQYYDLSAELRAAKAMQDRLIEIIKTGKGEVKDLLNVEKELAVWRGKAEKLEGELRYFDNQVSLSTLTISLFERDIRTAAAITENEQADAGVQVEDVEQARAAAIKAVEEGKGRIIEAELKKFDAGQLAAKVIADVPADNAGAVIDRLKQLGKVARLEITRKQTTADGSKVQTGARVEKGDTRIIASFYNLANIAPRQTVNLQLACDDVEQVYASVLSMAQKSSGRVLTSNLQRPQPGLVTGTIQFELPAAVADAELANLRAAGSPMQMTVSENPENANVTASKRGFTLSLISATAVAARQNVNLSCEAGDVPKTIGAIESAIANVGARLTDTTNSVAASGSARATLIIDMPAGKLDEMVRQIEGNTKVRSRSTNLNSQIPDGPAARARIALELATPDTIVSADSGFWKTVRQGLSTSFAGLMWSLQLIIIGVCLVAPWLVLIWAGMKIIKRRRAGQVA